ncbi:hypothetical protein JCM15519_26720 [Fundidesulfovibrio butyratiphilus]
MRQILFSALARSIALLGLCLLTTLALFPFRALAQESPPPDPTLDLPLPRGVPTTAPGLERRMAALTQRLSWASPGSDESLRASMGLGVLKVMAKRFDEGTALLDPVARSGSPLAGWAWLYLGLARRNLGDPAQALAAFDQAQSGPPELSPAREAALLRLYCLEALGRDVQALEGYRNLLARPGQAFRPVHLWRAASLCDKSGDSAQAQTYLRELIVQHAWSASAQKALPLARDMFGAGRADWSPDAPDVLAARAATLMDHALPGRALPLVDQLAVTAGADPAQALYLRGRVAYLRRHTQEAADAFAALAELHPASPLAPWALYQQARCLWRSGEENDATAMRELLRAALARADQNSDLVPSALRLLMLANLERARFDQAADAARRLAAMEPTGSENARQAVWLLGLIALAKGDWAAAETELTTWLGEAQNADRSAGLYWLARVAGAKGDKDLAAERFRRAFSARPGGYYAALAEERLAAMGQSPLRPEPVPGCPGRANDGPGAETKTEPPRRASGESLDAATARANDVSGLSGDATSGAAADIPASSAGDDPAAEAETTSATAVAETPEASSAEVRTGLERARLLEECQLPELAERDLAALLARYPTAKPVALAWAKLGQSRGDPLGAARAVSRAYAQCLAQGAPEDLAPLRDILYPRHFTDLLAQQLAGAAVDADLVCALIRQESFFQPAAVSPAGAVGLMQIMPATARNLAARLGYRDFRPESLRDPAVNIRLGVRLFLDRHERYGGNVAFALAAYNAGHVKLKVWAAHLGGLEPDLFTEFIPYGETRDYVKRILANRAMYRRLYPQGAASGPS